MTSVISGLSNGAYNQPDHMMEAILLSVAVSIICILLLRLQRGNFKWDLLVQREFETLFEEELWDRITAATPQEMDDIDWDLRCFDPECKNHGLQDHFHHKYIALIQGAM